MYLIKNAKIYAEDRVVEKGYIIVKDGKFKEIGIGDVVNDGSLEEIDVDGKIVLPGLIDMQINGGGGHFVMDATLEELEDITETHAKFGVTGLLATTVAWSDESQVNTLKACCAAMKEGLNGARILGIHMEGPFINPQKAGAHNKKYLVDPDIDKFNLFYESAGKNVKLVTVAPELTNASGLIKYLSKQDICVSVGHSNATYDEMNEAIRSGAKMATHLFNTMPGITAREPGIVMAALEDNDCMVSIIADGVHVHPSNLRLVKSLAGINRIILVTDCTPITGTGLMEWELEGHTVTIKGYTGYLSDGTIVGSVLTMNKALMNAKKFMGLKTEEAILMASTNPAKKLNMFDKKGSIALNKDADFIVVDDDISFEVALTFVEGELAYKR